MYKTCRVCGEQKPLADFDRATGPSRTSSRGTSTSSIGMFGHDIGLLSAAVSCLRR